MSFNRKNREYDARRKRHSEGKYRTGISAYKKYLTVILSLVFITALRQTGAAQDRGGFHVETLPGESEGLPSDWETGNGGEEFGEQQPSEENGYEDIFGSGEGNWQEDVYEEPESGDGSGWENSIGTTEETDEEYLEEPVSQDVTEQLPENWIEGGESDCTESVRNRPPYRTQLPVVTVSPAAAVDTAPDLEPELYQTEKTGKDNRNKVPERFSDQLNVVPEVVYWKGTIKKAGEPALSIKLNRNVQILSLRVNGKETRWHQEKSRIYLDIPEEQKESEEAFHTEIAFLSYNGMESGIYMDVPGKS